MYVQGQVYSKTFTGKVLVYRFKNDWCKVIEIVTRYILTKCNLPQSNMQKETDTETLFTAFSGGFVTQEKSLTVNNINYSLPMVYFKELRLDLHVCEEILYKKSKFS